MAPPLLVQPSGDMSVKIYKELCEDASAVPDKMKHIAEWLELQPHLPPFKDEQRIRTFLRGCKYSNEKTKKKLDMYFSMRAAVPEFYANRDPSSDDIQKVWNEVHMPPLPGLTEEGNRVVWMCGATPEMNITSAPNTMKLALMIGDLRLELEQMGVAGDVYVMDAAYATAQQFAKFTPALLKKFLISVQEAYPVRLRQVHVINVNPLVDVIFNFVKPLLKDKIKNRIYFHAKMDSFFKHVPKDMVPEEYGGNAGSLKDISANWKKTVESHRQWFLDQEVVKTDETRRPGKQMNYEELFGPSGSFRKLTID